MRDKEIEKRLGKYGLDVLWKDILKIKNHPEYNTLCNKHPLVNSMLFNTEKALRLLAEMDEEIENLTQVWFKCGKVYTNGKPYPEDFRASLKDVLADNKRMEKEIEQLKEQP